MRAGIVGLGLIGGSFAKAYSEAIGWAMAHAQKDDVIVLCGKGHETYQEIGHEKRHLDEREVVADFLGREV